MNDLPTFLPAQNQNPIMYCPIHKDEIDMFCRSHQLSFCQKCANDHILMEKQTPESHNKAHEVEKIVDVNLEAEEQMKGMLESLQNFSATSITRIAHDINTIGAINLQMREDFNNQV